MTNSNIKNMATIIAVLHLIRDGGISPKRLRTFSERSSISSDDFFCLSLSYLLYALLGSKFYFIPFFNNYVPNSS